MSQPDAPDDAPLGSATAPRRSSSKRAQLQRRISNLIAVDPSTGGWGPDGFVPDLGLLGHILALTDPAEFRGGSVATGLDFWAAATLRQAGLRNVLPHSSEPFYAAPVVRDTATFFTGIDEGFGALDRLEASLASIGQATEARKVRSTLARLRGRTRRVRTVLERSTTTVLGESRQKQVDVFIAGWDRGLELLVSTKTFALAADPRELVKNLPNRWEEFDGDLKNLRGRFPLAVIGALTLLPATSLQGTLQAFVDMMTKLTAPGRPWVNAYDAAAILIADWSDQSNGAVRILNPSLGDDQLPTALQPAPFFNVLLERLLQRAPVTEHLDARVAQIEGEGRDAADVRSAASASARVQEDSVEYEGGG